MYFPFLFPKLIDEYNSEIALSTHFWPKGKKTTTLITVLFILLCNRDLSFLSVKITFLLNEGN